MKWTIYTIALVCGLALPAAASEIVELRHRDIESRDTYKLYYWCLTRDQVPVTYQTNGFEIAVQPLKLRAALAYLKLYKFSVFLTTENCLAETLDWAQKSRLDPDAFRVMPVEP
jgi:hypothetical protein